MAFNYKKLTADVKLAMDQGQQAADAVSDGGSCNLDGVLLRLPRLPQEKVVAALLDAGINTEKSDWGWLGTGYMINPPWGQADKRYWACQKISKALKEAGYSAPIFYMVD